MADLPGQHTHTTLYFTRQGLVYMMFLFAEMLEIARILEAEHQLKCMEF